MRRSLGRMLAVLLVYCCSLLPAAASADQLLPPRHAVFTGLTGGSYRAASTASVSSREAAELRRDDRGVYVAFCPAGEEAASIAAMPRASVAEASHAGWPPEECLKMDKGPLGAATRLLVSSRIARRSQERPRHPGERPPRRALAVRASAATVMDAPRSWLRPH
jgi:hypothetical protein